MSSKMSCTFPNNCNQKNLWKLINQFSPQITFGITESEAYIQCMDSSHTSLFNLNITSDLFQEFNIDESKTYGLNTDTMIKINNGGDGANITWSFNDNETIDIHIEPSKSDCFTTNCTLNTMNIDQELMSIPETDWTYIYLKTSAFKKVIGEIKSLSDEISHVTLSLCDNGLLCHVDTTLISNYNVTVPMLEDTKIYISEDDDISKNNTRSYQLTLLKNILDNVINLGSICKLHWANGRPLYLSFVEPNSKISKIGKLDMYLAPRIDDNDDE